MFRIAMTYTAIIILVLFLLYTSFFLTKNITFTIFYKPMVEETIKETVKERALKND